MPSSSLATYLAHLPDEPDAAEVLVVDDGSTDATAKIAGAIGDARVRVIRSWPNQGKGFAVRTGMLAATGDLPVFTDADGAYGPGDMDQVVRALAAAPVAIGTRGPAASASLVRRVASRVEVLLLADGRRMLGEVWSVRRSLRPDHRAQGRAYV